MKTISLRTAKPAAPMIYAYSTPQIAENRGWTKIGYTEGDVQKRIDQQTYTANVQTKLEWKGNALFDDGSFEAFTDKDFHAYLTKQGIARKPGKEWFRIDGPAGRRLFDAFRRSRGVLDKLDAIPYTLRAEQEEAVQRTLAYRKAHPGGEYLWNAKPRFGKTLAVYDFCKRAGAASVLIVTNRPAIANSWYSDYVRFFGTPSGYRFISETDALKGLPHVMSRAEWVKYDDKEAFFEFVSLQDLKGSLFFGGRIDKLKHIKDTNWDVLVIDEAHEGVDTFKTDAAFERVQRQFTLHLSGTPFKALANDKFAEDAIYNWTYADEQKAKADWQGAADENNPYEGLPRLNLYTYQMSEIIRDELSRGLDLEGKTEEYAFDLNEFFATNESGRFTHDESVDRFLDALTTQEKFPFSTEALRKELKHTFWLLNRVDSAKALARKLEKHPVFKEYEIVLAAGDGKLDDSEESEKSFDKVRNAIAKHAYTITLSVGQLTTGVTIPEWTAVLMLSNVKSPALYMQAAFRAQNPWMYRDKSGCCRKENAYVFDFDPARTLTIFEEFANDLSADTARGKGNTENRREHVRELLNFFPVLGEDEEGEMVALDAEKVLSIPRKIRSQEVVRRGFMSNYLFQNISNIFGAPQVVVDILKQFQPVKEPKAKDIPVTPDTAEKLHINPESGAVELPKEQVIGTAQDIFGDKIYGPDAGAAIGEKIAETFDAGDKTIDATRAAFETLREQLKEAVVPALIDTAKEHYAEDLNNAGAKRLEKKLDNDFQQQTEKIYNNWQIDQRQNENDLKKALENRAQSGKSAAAIRAEFAEKQDALREKLQENLQNTIESFTEKATQDIVQSVETKKLEKEKDSIEDSVRDHLRGFARTIPSFLMAYGTEKLTLANFDENIPDKVFREVTSITLEEFRFLRDGGPYTDENGEMQHYEGQLFDPVVFDDSVKEFLRLKKKLADYFDESQTEDIFDYIPPQKTNQIFTPKAVVKQMADLLEQENPGCFNDPEKTFIDLYMKSGLYITEIVRRLYRSEGLKRCFPEGKARLRHIFEKQVYGLAPTEIIFRIATAYIFGFDEGLSVPRHHFQQLDTLPYAKAGTLAEKLDELFEEK